MQTNAREILEKLRSKKATNINNSTTINYNNNNNNSTTSLICETSHNHVEEKERSSSVGLASEEALSPVGLKNHKSRDSINFVGGKELPPSIRGIKWDIYKNFKRSGKGSNIKVKMTVIKTDRSTQSLTASMNSPHDRLWRGVEDQQEETWQTEHWQVMRELYKDYRHHLGPTTDAWRVSKFYLNNKKSSINSAALFLHWTDTDYCLRLVRLGKIYDYLVPFDSFETLSESQLRTNQCATAYFGRSQVKMIDITELGI